MTDARYGWCGGGTVVRPAAGMVRIGFFRFRLFPRACKTGIRGILFSGEEEASFAEGAYSYRT